MKGKQEVVLAERSAKSPERSRIRPRVDPEDGVSKGRDYHSAEGTTAPQAESSRRARDRVYLRLELAPVVFHNRIMPWIDQTLMTI